MSDYINRHTLKEARERLRDWSEFSGLIQDGVRVKVVTTVDTGYDMVIVSTETPSGYTVHAHTLTDDAMTRLRRLKELVALFNDDDYVTREQFDRVWWTPPTDITPAADHEVQPIQSLPPVLPPDDEVMF